MCGHDRDSCAPGDDHRRSRRDQEPPLRRVTLHGWCVERNPAGRTYRFGVGRHAVRQAPVVSEDRLTAWIGSDDGTVLRTVDGGQS